ncbi:MAG: hypothetical protein HLUCCA12_13485 [Rhodobacteraceae bacterium HLUCCA12]|nr:MAG: hypothetical protein HLUCCA12_13485 [Rhodobacteraceae bacterium HLUCCA12]
MIVHASGFGAVTQKTSRRLFGLLAAAVIALAGLSATTAPARSDTTDDLLRLFLGIAAVAVIVNAIDDDHTPRYIGEWTLPSGCQETVRVRGRLVQTYNARCLERAGYYRLPQRCRLSMRTNRGHRPSYLAQCLYDAGYRAERHVRPVRPEPGPVRGAVLPRGCEMIYRQSGRRVEGYDGQCLENRGFYRLPRQCRVSDRQGNHYYNARCLLDSGYRRAR